MDSVRPQLSSWHHDCGHDCRDGLGCDRPEHYLDCECLMVRERHVEDPRQKMVATLEWWG
jgi:hypothetical protein